MKRRRKGRIERKVLILILTSFFFFLLGKYIGCVNLSFAYVEGESLLMALKDIALSSGSACTSASLEPSYVLRALGADDETAHSSIRFGIGRFTTEEEIDFVIDKVSQHVQKLRDMSPLWEMVRNCYLKRGKEWKEKKERET